MLKEDLKTTTPGVLLSRCYGKYEPGIVLVYEGGRSYNDYRDKELESKLDKYVSANRVECYRGEKFRKNKKENRVFNLKENGDEVLISLPWGGAFSETSGTIDLEFPHLYYKRTSSNGGGLGTNYIIAKVKDVLEALEKGLDIEEV